MKMDKTVIAALFIAIYRLLFIYLTGVYLHWPTVIFRRRQRQVFIPTHHLFFRFRSDFSSEFFSDKSLHFGNFLPLKEVELVANAQQMRGFCAKTGGTFRAAATRLVRASNCRSMRAGGYATSSLSRWASWSVAVAEMGRRFFFRGTVAANEKGGVNFAKTLDKVKRECYNMIREFF